MKANTPDEVIARASNEWLEDSIAAYYWELYLARKWTVAPKSRVLDALWVEFDRRMAEGEI